MSQILEASLPLYGGYVLSRADGVVFLKGAIPGEKVEAEITEKKRDYSLALVREVHEPSPHRVEPRCPAFGLCGGCHYQHVSYAGQLQMKEAVLRDLLKRIGKIETPIDATIESAPWHYRKRVRFKVSRAGKLGFYRPLSHDVVEVEHCYLIDRSLNLILERINSTGLPEGVKELLIQSGDLVVARVYGEKYVRSEVEKVLAGSGITGVLFDHEGGEEVRSCLDLNGKYYCVTPGAFFQSNWELNRRVVSMISNDISNIAPGRVVDFYAGGGNFSIPISEATGEVVAVEQSELSYGDAIYNMEINGIDNVKYIQSPVEKAKLRGRVDAVILDPPRTGISRPLLEKIGKILPQWIYYVSCNPSTLARDLGRLSDMYEIESIRLIDMFPQTYHIESFAKLRRKEETTGN